MSTIDTFNVTSFCSLGHSEGRLLFYHAFNQHFYSSTAFTHMYPYNIKRLLTQEVRLECIASYLIGCLRASRYTLVVTYMYH